MRAAVSLVAVTALISIGVNGHGYMTNPPSRDILKLGSGNPVGFPINMKPGSCTTFPQSAISPMVVGSNTINLQFNDGANHIGPCKMQLADPNNPSNRLDLVASVGAVDCARTDHPGPGSKGDPPIPGHMVFDIPASGLPCDPSHCILIWNLRAEHLGVDNPEFYETCADVSIQGASTSTQIVSQDTKPNQGTNNPVVQGVSDTPSSPPPKPKAKKVKKKKVNKTKKY